MDGTAVKAAIKPYSAVMPNRHDQVTFMKRASEANRIASPLKMNQI